MTEPANIGVHKDRFPPLTIGNAALRRYKSMCLGRTPSLLLRFFRPAVAFYRWPFDHCIQYGGIQQKRGIAAPHWYCQFDAGVTKRSYGCRGQARYRAGGPVWQQVQQGFEMSYTAG